MAFETRTVVVRRPTHARARYNADRRSHAALRLGLLSGELGERLSHLRELCLKFSCTHEISSSDLREEAALV